MKTIRNYRSKSMIVDTDRTIQFATIVLIINWALPITLYIRGDGNFSLLFFCVLGLAILHSASIWYLYQQVYHSRQQVVKEFQEMLQDLIRNQLAIIVLSLSTALQPDLDKTEQAELRKQRVTRSVERITTVIDNLSLGSLDEWKRSRPRNMG